VKKSRPAFGLHPHARAKGSSMTGPEDPSIERLNVLKEMIHGTVVSERHTPACSSPSRWTGSSIPPERLSALDVFDSREFRPVSDAGRLMMLTEKTNSSTTNVTTCPWRAPGRAERAGDRRGDGGVVRELTRYESVQRIDMVEIDPGGGTCAENTCPRPPAAG
jgi:hypothetical protein